MNKEQKNKTLLVTLLVIGILVIDQIIKIWVKTSMYIGESIPVFGSWFQILFIENEGMAFGMKFGGNIGKIILTLFRLLASAGIIWVLAILVRKNSPKFLLVSVALILAGAFGNIIDSCFYGLIFNDNPYEIATLFPDGGGYAPFLSGKVVDMFYFPIIDTTLPSWFPFWGGEHFTFFNAIFNFADASITIGVVLLLIDQFFGHKNEPKKTENPEK